MIAPLARMAVRGVIWYQGEGGTGTIPAYPPAAKGYGCLFPAMIDSWAKHWSVSNTGVKPSLPFGFVQLAASESPETRWAQTAGYGYAPNRRMPAVFMTTAIDLSECTVDVHGTTKCETHSHYKQEVGARLAWAARPVVYGEAVDLPPYAISAENMEFNGKLAVKIKFAGTPLALRSGAESAEASGFEVCGYQYNVHCTRGYRAPWNGPRGGSHGRWYPAAVLDWSDHSIIIELPSNLTIESIKAEAVRYEYFSTPCFPKGSASLAHHRCGVYAKNLPPVDTDVWAYPALPSLILADQSNSEEKSNTLDLHGYTPKSSTVRII